ncbi:MAG: hypothetical protein V3V08_17060, partial [Nannocystaceae bacterium]
MAVAPHFPAAPCGLPPATVPAKLLAAAGLHHSFCRRHGDDVSPTRPEFITRRNTPPKTTHPS